MKLVGTIAVALPVLVAGLIAVEWFGIADLPFEIPEQIRYGSDSSVAHERSLEEIALLPVSEMFAEATDHTQQGELDLALVILEGAASRGHAPSALAIGEMYDPSLWGRVPSPLTQPDEIEARRWYARATELGDGRGRERLAELQDWIAAQ